MKAAMMAVAMAGLMAAGGAMAGEKMMPMPMKDMVHGMKADKDGMISVKEVMEMERKRIEAMMKEKGMKGDKMSKDEWEKFYDQIYRGV